MRPKNGYRDVIVWWWVEKSGYVNVVTMMVNDDVGRVVWEG